jgi:hypothetical protein
LASRAAITTSGCDVSSYAQPALSSASSAPRSAPTAVGRRAPFSASAWAGLGSAVEGTALAAIGISPIARHVATIELCTASFATSRWQSANSAYRRDASRSAGAIATSAATRSAYSRAVGRARARAAACAGEPAELSASSIRMKSARMKRQPESAANSSHASSRPAQWGKGVSSPPCEGTGTRADARARVGVLRLSAVASGGRESHPSPLTIDPKSLAVSVRLPQEVRCIFQRVRVGARSSRHGRSQK